MKLIISYAPIPAAQLKRDNPGYHIANELSEFHVKAAGIRSKVQLDEALETPPAMAIRLDKISGFDEYKKTLDQLTETHGGKWLINDCRVLWFYEQFSKLIEGNMEIDALESENDDYNTFLNHVLSTKKKTAGKRRGVADITTGEFMESVEFKGGK